MTSCVIRSCWEPSSCKLHSVRWSLARRPSTPNERDGAHWSKGCTRGTVGLWCDLLLLRVLRIATITLAASRYRYLYSATLHARSDLYDVL